MEARGCSGDHYMPPTIFAASLRQADHHEKTRPTFETELSQTLYDYQSQGFEPRLHKLTRQD
jgi:hypothetical protein